MQLARWNPFQEMEDIFTRFQRDVGRPLVSETGEPALTVWSPAVDISESDKEYLVKAELPGVKKEDVKVNIENGILTLTGERRFEKVEEDEKYHRVERTYGSFSRSFTLPEDVLQDKITADYKDGMIAIHLTKTHIKKAKSAEIKVQ